MAPSDDNATFAGGIVILCSACLAAEKSGNVALPQVSYPNANGISLHAMNPSHFFEVQVDAAPDPVTGIRPLAFSLGKRSIAVREILDRWPATGYSYTKLLGDDDAVYILRHDEMLQRWEMTFFKSPDAT